MQHRPARRSAWAGPACDRYKGPNPVQTGLCVGHMASTKTNEGKSLDEPRTNRLEWRFASWNVGTLSRKSGEVADELWKRRVDVCGVQETRWRGESTRFVGAKGRRYKFWGKGEGIGGVGVMVKENLVEQVCEVRRRSDRVLVVVMVIGKVMVRVISAYAPQHNRSEREKDIFYEELDEELGQAGLDDFVVVLGDLNGHVGEDADGYEGVHGGFGYGVRNKDGRRVLEFGEAHGLVVGNTWFKRSKGRMITYRSGDVESVIDYVLVREKDRKFVQRAR